MQVTWDDRSPIYRQLADRFRDLIIDGVFQNGDALPSVRQVASEQQINPLTVLKAFQILVDDGLVEARIIDLSTGTDLSRLTKNFAET